MRIAICDDESRELERLAALLVEYRARCGFPLEFSLFTSASDLLSGVRGGELDVLILDVVMPGFNGIQTARELRAIDQTVKILFLSATPEFAVESYSVGAYHYLLKPPTDKALFPLLDQIQAELSAPEEDALLLRGRDGVARIPYSRMEYVEVMNKTVFLHLTDGSMRETTGTLAEFEERLLERPEFLRVHRSYLMNLRFIQSVNHDGILTQSGRKVPVARAMQGPVKEAYLRLLFQTEPKSPAPPPSPAAHAAPAVPPPAEHSQDGAWRILLVDDDPSDRARWVALLRARGCVVREADGGTAARRLAAAEPFDCVLLDVLLPDETGFSLCHTLGEATGAPVLFLSCLTDSDNQLKGFSVGGADYITKDTPAELFWAKVETRIRLSRTDRTQLRFGPLTMDLDRRRLTVEEGEIILTPTEFDLLWLMAGRADTIFTPEELYHAVWGAQQWDGGHAVQVHMSRLRRKMEKAYPKHFFIDTVWGQGYRFIPISE